ncbi:MULTISPECIES: Tol-Pal system protein TolB [unclassified Helicobacter]|uniref:Tol-Pal system protein TolB n=1 Tax=unclassified Helicobacter TaxID=2593540 RepID=UPI000CF04FC1|nr:MULTISPECIES: Tol-Pal system protein TolB [unclassified Helicobacter]
MNKIFSVLLLVICVAFGADATIDLVKTIQKIPTIQVTYFDNKNAEQALKVYKILLGDLNISGHFSVQEGKKGKIKPNYMEFLGNKIDLLVNIEAQRNDEGFKIIVKLFDINAQNLILDKAYMIDDEKLYPFVAHKIAIDINDYIKAPSIDWMRRYVVLSTYVGPGRTNIMISDYTLTYKKVIINDGLNIFPKWANKEQTEIYYTKFVNNMPTIIKYNVYTGVSTEIEKSSGMAVVSDVSQDSNKLLLTLAPMGDPDIFLFDTQTKQKTQLTKYRGIDVSGSFVENDGAIIFVSDRLGYPNVFYKSLEDGAPVEQVVYHGRNNSSVSSHKDYVVYSSRETSNDFGPNTFNLYLISTKNDFIRRLTANGINQLPRFSSDGGSIMFVKNQTNQSALGIIRLDYNKTFLFPLENIYIQSFDW